MEADNRQFDGKLFLKDVNRKLNDRLAEIQKDLNQGLKEIENMHEYYWENYTEMDQYGYEDYDNQQALLQQVNANRDKSKLMKRLEKMIDSLEFRLVPPKIHKFFSRTKKAVDHFTFRGIRFSTTPCTNNKIKQLIMRQWFIQINIHNIYLTEGIGGGKTILPE